MPNGTGDSIEPNLGCSPPVSKEMPLYGMPLRQVAGSDSLFMNKAYVLDSEPLSPGSSLGLTQRIEIEKINTQSDIGPRLVGISGAQLGRVIEIPPSGLSIGRRSTHSLVLDLAGVSKDHCSLGLDGHKVWVLDHGSTNGTLLNGRPIAPNAPHLLTHGDTLRILDESFTFFAQLGRTAEDVSVAFDVPAVAAEAEQWFKAIGDLQPFLSLRQR